jgi:hypothetical protein
VSEPHQASRAASRERLREILRAPPRSRRKPKPIRSLIGTRHYGHVALEKASSGYHAAANIVNNKYVRGAITAAVFGACVVVSVGSCLVIGTAAAFVMNIRSNGKFDPKGFAIDESVNLVTAGAGRYISGSWTKNAFERPGLHLRIPTLSGLDMEDTAVNAVANAGLAAGGTQTAGAIKGGDDGS